MRRQATLAMLAALALLLQAGTAYAEGEPGNGFSTALEVTEGEHSFYMAAGDFHFFKVMLNAGEVLVVTLRMPLREDFDIFLLGPARDFLEGGTKPAGLMERVSVLASTTGYYYIVVSSFGGSSGVYTMTIDIIEPKVVEVTTTKTLTETTTFTEVSYSVYTVTATVERQVTVTETVDRRVETIPWSMLGFLAIALAVVYLGSALGRASGERRTAVPE